MPSAKQLLHEKIDQVSEEDAREVLELLRTKKNPTREELIRRAAGHPGIHAPDPNAPPFRRVEPIECPGIPASELLIRDRR
jgi:hypothetical protein